MNRRTAVIAVVLAALSAPLAGGPSSHVAWTLDTVKLVRGGDSKKGQTLHGDCSGCHGETGDTDTPDVPNLAGQERFYIFKQLQDYKSKSRASSMMSESAAPLSDRDMADLAAFYAAQKPSRGAGSGRRPDAAISALVALGDGTRLIPACDACHGRRGEGNPGFYGMPGLRNQKEVDLSYQLTTFRSGERGNDVYRVMRDISKKLTDDEIASLAAYYAGAEKKPATAAAQEKK
ncbi:MAG: c-type cytochrome [Acidobacteriota bacterium]|nr:c-type cytochrome [Acidobacteriota bacterium]